LVYVIPSAVSAYFVILIRTYIQQMPKELEESALMDGAGITRVYRSIIFPLCKPIVAAISVFAAVGQWNAWFDNMMYVTRRSLFTLQYILYQFLAGAQATAMAAREAANMAEFGQNSVSAVTPMSIQMTITVIAVVPIFVVYPFFQRYFAKGIMIGAVKG
jgi:putative aldouronate transport system permease protein